MNDNSNLSPHMTSDSVECPRLLVVDDMAENIAILLDALKDDYSVIAARNGSQALQLAMSVPPPNLILLDIVMPEMDGYQVCASLKERKETRDIPIIFLTALEEEEDETHGLSLGAVDFIRKPIHPITLLLRVKLHLELFQSRRRLEEQNRQLLETVRLREDIEFITRHDLKNPLNVIFYVPDILLTECNFTDSQKDLISMLTEAGNQMLEMINRSLDLVKIERGIYDFRPEPVDVLSVMRRVLADLASKITAKNLQIILRVDNQLMEDGQKVMVMAESLFCYSMISNLITNAIEASPYDEVINVKFNRGAEVIMLIENKGEVPEIIRECFFDKYVTAGKIDGTGLGTYSSKMIAVAQKGTIDLDTSVAGRTCIRVTIPAAS